METSMGSNSTYMEQETASRQLEDGRNLTLAELSVRGGKKMMAESVRMREWKRQANQGSVLSFGPALGPITRASLHFRAEFHKQDFHGPYGNS